MSVDYNFEINVDDATKKMLTSNLNILDANWYLQKILQPLSGKNMLVESFSFMQTGSYEGDNGLEINRVINQDD